MNQEIAEISLSKPETLKAFSVELKKFIISEKLFSTIQGKNFVGVEGWQFAGASLGLVPVVEKCERLEREDEITYTATVAVYQGERVVSRGFALCSNKERSKEKFDEYAIASMAQTRATGKAYRLLLGWLMKMAGYEATPSEEMPKEEKTVMSEGEHCLDCNGPMKMRKNGNGSYCPNKYGNASCPPKKMDEADKRIAAELDEIPVIQQ